MKHWSKSLEILILVAVVAAAATVAYLYYECGPEKCYGGESSPFNVWI